MTDARPGLLDAMRRELLPVAAEARKAKEVAYECKETLIEKFGKSGKNGDFGHLEDDVEANTARTKKNFTEIQWLKHQRRTQLTWSGLGAVGGGGGLIGLIELLKWLA